MEKGGVDSSLFKNVDKDISKTEALITKMMGKLQSGFRDTKEVIAFEKEIGQVATNLNQIGVGLKRANFPENFGKAAERIEDLSINLKVSQQNLEKAKQSALAFVDAQRESGRYTKAQANEIKNAADNEEELLKVVKKVNEEQSKKAQTSITKSLSSTKNGPISDTTKANMGAAITSGLSSEATLNLAGANIGIKSLEAYKEMMRQVILEGKSLSDAFNNLQSEFDQNDKEILESEKFVEAYTQDLKTLALTAADVGKADGYNISKGNISRQANTISAMGSSTVSGEFVPNTSGYDATIAKIQTLETEILQLKNEIYTLQNAVNSSVTVTNGKIDEANVAINNNATAWRNSGEATREAVVAAENFDNTFNNLQNIAKQVLSLTSAWRMFRQQVVNTYNDVKELDKSFAKIAMVTNYQVSDLWEQYENYADMANRLGQSTQSVVEASGLFYQQGLDTAEALALTEDTMKLATLAGLDFSEATSQMTAALRAFHMEMDEGSHITDVYAELAAHAAADVQGIAYAMSKTASIANSAGMAFETTSAFLTQMIETTQEAPENIGTAMKTIIARFTELKENVAGTADSEFDDLDYNKVDKALKTVGISIKDATGQFRNLDEVFLELSEKWDSLDRNSQRYIATIAAGSRQQSRFIAMMENYDRTIQLVNTAYNSAGKSSEQFAKFSDSVEFKVNKLKNTWEQFRINLLSSEGYKSLLDTLTQIIEKFEGIDLKKLLVLVPTIIVIGRTLAKNWIQGFSDGLKNGSNLIDKAISKVTNTKTQAEIKVDIENAKLKLEELKREKEKLNQVLANSPASQLAQDYMQALQVVRQIENQLDKMPATIDKSDPEYTEWINKLKEANAEADKLGKNLQKVDPDTYNATNNLNDNENKAQGYKKIIEENDKPVTAKKVGVNLGSALGQSMATAAMMAFSGGFNLSDIAKTTAFQSGLSAITSALSGNFSMAIAQLGVTAISGLMSVIAEQVEKRKEAYREEHDEAYKIAKQIEVETEKQEELNEKLDEANQKYDEANKAHQDFTQAVDTYKELSKKISLSEEEQEELNQATEDLIDLHPELISGYDSTGKAILKVGEAWDEVIDKENEAYKLSQLYQNQAEIAAYGQNLKIAKKEKEAAETLIDAFDNLPDTENTVNYYEDSWDKISAYGTKIAEFVVPGVRQANHASYAATGKDIVDNTYGVGIDDLLGIGDKKALKEWAKENAEYGRALLLTIKQTTDYEGNLVDEAIDKIDDFEKLREQWYQNIVNTDQAKSDAEKLVQEANAQYHMQEESFKTSILEGTKILLNEKGELDKFSEQQNNILTELISKTLINNKDLQEAYENGTQASYQQELANSDEAQEIVKELDNLTKSQIEVIDEYLNNYQTEEIISTEQLKQQLEKTGFGEYIIKYLTGINDEIINQKEVILSNLTTLFYGDQHGLTPGEKLTSENFLNDTKLGQIFNEMGYEAASNFFSGLSKFKDNETTQAFLKNLENSLTNAEIDPQALQYLISINWDEASFTNINDMKQEFLDYCSELNIGVEEAEKIWNDYKNFLSSLGLINLTTNALGLEQLEAELDEKLVTKVGQSSNLSSAVEKQLTNGFLNFSESQAFEKACQEIGLKAEDYLTYNADGSILLNTEKLKQGLKDQEQAEKDIVLQLREEQQNKIDTLKTQLAQLRSIQQQIIAQKGYNKEGQITADILWDQADAISVMTKGELVSSTRQITYYESDFDYDTLNKNIENLIESTENDIKDLEDVMKNDLVEGSDFMERYMAKVTAGFKQFYTDISDVETKVTQELEKAVEDATEKVEDAAEKVASALEDVKKAEQDVIDKTNELNEKLYGTDNYKNKTDGLYNYTTQLERLSKAAENAKNTLDNLQGENAEENLNKYLDKSHQEVVSRKAENQVIQQSINNYQDVLNSKLGQAIADMNSKYGSNMDINVSDFYYKNGDRWAINFAALNAANIPDEISDYVEETVEQMNKLEDSIESNSEAIKKREKEIRDIRKKGLEAEVNLEQKVADVLKEKYQEEVDDLKDKYDAMKDADDKYLDALEDSINKQRELRNRQNEWENLATKEKKLSLMQRDTSGANKVATQKLQKEIQSDREKLLDDSIDNIIENLKELYETQQETREAEIEYQENLLENSDFIKEANVLISSWTSADDAIQFFYENVQNISKMSEAQLEKEEESWREMYEAHTLYTATNTKNFKDMLDRFESDAIATNEEIQQTIKETSETLTKEANRSLNEITTKASESIENAKQAVKDALETLAEKQRAYNEAVQAQAEAVSALATATRALMDARKLYEEAANQTGNEDNVISASISSALAGLQIALSRSSSSNSSIAGTSQGDNTQAKYQEYKAQNSLTNASPTIDGGWKYRNLIEEISTLESGHEQFMSKELLKSKYGVTDLDDLISYLIQNKLGHGGLIKDRENNTIGIRFTYSKPKNTDEYAKVFKTGGLVNYTGPAWVDGTPNKPEAFLNSTDTERIGQAAELLASISDFLNFNRTSAESIVNNNSITGDTIVNVVVNVDSISDDYDVDSAIERVKEDIAQAANFAGANVILRQ